MQPTSRKVILLVAVACALLLQQVHRADSCRANRSEAARRTIAMLLQRFPELASELTNPSNQQPQQQVPTNNQQPQPINQPSQQVVP